MTKRLLLVVTVVIVGGIGVFGQTAGPAYPPADPMVNISVELTRVRAAVASLSKSMIDFVDKFEKVGGITFTEKQQKLILGMELLQKSEARLATLQQAQIVLVEKLNENRAKLAQNEVDSRPRNIDRGFAMEGTTELVELKENKVAKLQSERQQLMMLVQQIQSNLAETTEAVRDAQALVNRLRRQYLPQLEREIFENVREN
jgi:hypothetical protein